MVEVLRLMKNPISRQGMAILDTIVADMAVPALGAAVVDSNEPIDMAVSGVRERGGATLVGIVDQFRLGTNSKAKTAVLVARLGQQDLEHRSGGAGMD